MQALGLAATAYMNPSKMQEAKCHIATFLELTTSIESTRTSVINTIEDLVILCYEKDVVKEVEQLFIFKILIIKTAFSGHLISPKNIVKRILDLKERQGTVGSPMIFNPSELIQSKRERRAIIISSLVARETQK